MTQKRLEQILDERLSDWKFSKEQLALMNLSEKKLAYSKELEYRKSK